MILWCIMAGFAVFMVIAFVLDLQRVRNLAWWTFWIFFLHGEGEGGV